MVKKGKVYFIGAGPGDLDLLTVKGKRLLESADVLVYADSLVNPAVEGMVKRGARIYRSAGLTLQEMVDIMIEAARAGKVVARLHTGDPSVFSAVHEQRVLLDEAGVEHETVPGVSSVFAAAAALNLELTLPGVSQTLILTRLEGRTPMPPSEKLRELARHGATLALFLSTAYLPKVVAELKEGGYPAETPVAVVSRASWPDQKIVRGTLASIEAAVNEGDVDNPSLVLVGKAVGPASIEAKALRSRLYDANFSHGRRATHRGRSSLK